MQTHLLMSCIELWDVGQKQSLKKPHTDITRTFKFQMERGLRWDLFFINVIMKWHYSRTCCTHLFVQYPSVWPVSCVPAFRRVHFSLPLGLQDPSSGCLCCFPSVFTPFFLRHFVPSCPFRQKIFPAQALKTHARLYFSIPAWMPPDYSVFDILFYFTFHSGVLSLDS